MLEIFTAIILFIIVLYISEKNNKNSEFYKILHS